MELPTQDESSIDIGILSSATLNQDLTPSGVSVCLSICVYVFSQLKQNIWSKKYLYDNYDYFVLSSLIVADFLMSRSNNKL